MAPFHGILHCALNDGETLEASRKCLTCIHEGRKIVSDETLPSGKIRFQKVVCGNIVYMDGRTVGFKSFVTFVEPQDKEVILS